PRHGERPRRTGAPAPRGVPRRPAFAGPGGTLGRARMRVSVVTMAFPWPSETFAARDFRALRARGASITVHPLRRKLPSQDALAHEQRVADVPARHPSIPALAALLLPGGPGLGRILRLALRIVRDRDTAWRERVRCLVLLPFA